MKSFTARRLAPRDAPADAMDPRPARAPDREVTMNSRFAGATLILALLVLGTLAGIGPP